MAKSIQVQDLGRLQQILSVLAKYGFGQLFTSLGFAEARGQPDAEVGSSPLARRLRHALIELGPTFVKLGQVFSVRPDVLPPDIIQEFQSLQDRVPPMAPEDVRTVVESELELPFDEVFEEFEWEPLGSASIAQVHRARLHSGEEVAVKVQRRGIAHSIRSDMHILYSLAGVLEKRIKLPGVHTPSTIVREFDVAITAELDFTQEMRAAERFFRSFEGHPDVVIPRPHPRWCTRRLLVMDLIEGRPLKEFLGVSKVNAESRALAHRIMDCAYQQIFEDGHFHGDPHPGNILVLDDGRVGIIDFGLTGTLTAPMQDTIISAFTAMVFRDAETLAMTVYKAGATRGRVDLREFRGEIERMMDKYHGVSLDEVTQNPDALMEVVQLAARFQIDLPPEFAILSRTFGLIEGSIRGLLPGVDIVEEVKPYAQRLVASRLSPERVAVDVARGIVQLQGHFKDFPTQLTQLMMDAESGRLTVQVRNRELDSLTDAIRMGGLRISLALFASTVSLGALLFLAAWSPRPFELPLFGVLGMFMGVLGVVLFGALGIHVFFAQFLAISFWRRAFGRLVGFFTWRRRDDR
ncbi:MAG: AarF/ABC1/UbiB kinase family protein [Deltaproteobacteria bacterium]|nr:MAG: AarF/ABC1/UbiB kinase family protein [Deltaproteobacteria bacterium]